jgi:hypothetical protein
MSGQRVVGIGVSTGHPDVPVRPDGTARRFANTADGHAQLVELLVSLAPQWWCRWRPAGTSGRPTPPWRNPPKVVLIAVARKLVVMLNAVLRDLARSRTQPAVA